MVTTSTEADEIARAELDVEQSQAQLAQSLRQVGNSSAKLARRLGNELRPSATVMAVAGAALLLGVGIVVVRRGRSQRSWLVPERPPVLGAIAKTVGLFALRFVARRAAEAAVKRWTADPALTPARP